MRKKQALSAQQKKTNLIRKCRSCKIIKKEEKFFYAPFNCLKSTCIDCFKKRCDTHKKYRGEDPTKTTKLCNKCGETKLLCYFEFFGLSILKANDPNQRVPPGFRKQCNQCKTHRTKNTPSFKNYKANKKIVKAKDKKMYRRKKGTINRRYSALTIAGKTFNVDIMNSLEYLKILRDNNFKCYYDGEKLPLDRTNAYFLDRIGLVKHGGDGKKGGAYLPENVVVSNSCWNYFREWLDLSPAEMKQLVNYLKKNERELFLKIKSTRGITALTTIFIEFFT